MPRPDDELARNGPTRCSVCGRTFEDGDELEDHVRDQGLLW